MLNHRLYYEYLHFCSSCSYVQFSVFLCLLLPFPAVFEGSNLFLAIGRLVPFSHAEARAICLQQNAMLPRHSPAQTFSLLNSKFMSLSRSHGHYLNFWLNECTSSGECYIWSIDSYTASKSKISTLGSGSSNGSLLIACETGEPASMTNITVLQ